MPECADVNVPLEMAKKLVNAHELACCSEFIICNVCDNGKEITKLELNLL